IAGTELFAERQRRTVAGARIIAERLLGAGGDAGDARGASGRGAGTGASGGAGLNVLSGGTDVHLVLVDLRDLRPQLSGREAEDRLHEIGITVNRNAVPFDPRPPMEASGLRIGTPALATRGLLEEDFAEVGQILARALLSPDFNADAAALAERVQAIVARYPLYESLALPAAA
ncbi:MAG TPA: hypothetical protein VMG80_06765, partial [Solirubrobacteraceae bacterium]|nr:hypothetical protein [Solirubrobacteraceae bacterium]